MTRFVDSYLLLGPGPGGPERGVQGIDSGLPGEGPRGERLDQRVETGGGDGTGTAPVVERARLVIGSVVVVDEA